MFHPFDKFRAPRRSFTANLMLLMTAFLWGVSLVSVKVALGEVGPFTFLSARFWLAFAVLVVPFFNRLRRGGRSLWRAGGVLGAALFAAYALQTVGLRTTTAGRAGFLTGLFVVLVPLLSALVLRRPPALNVWGAALLAVLGVALLSLPIDRSLAFGDGLMLLCALMVAIHILLVDRQVRRHDPLALGAIQIGVVALFSGLAALLTEPLPVRFSPAVWGAILFTALPATALALLLQVAAQRRTPPHQAALLLTLEPVFATLTAFLFLGERLNGRGLAGCGLILIAMLVAEAPIFNLHLPPPAA